jgi:hypothetical protein
MLSPAAETLRGTDFGSTLILGCAAVDRIHSLIATATPAEKIASLSVQSLGALT